MFLDHPGEFDWGGNDCCLFPANWVRLVTGIDGGARWRGTYSTEAECAAILERDGGVQGVMGWGAECAGLAPTDSPIRGDVAAVEVFSPSGRIEIGAICTGSRWAAISHRGLRMLKAQPLAAWRLPNVG